jgi:hypothetical protein
MAIIAACRCRATLTVLFSVAFSTGSGGPKSMFLSSLISS